MLKTETKTFEGFAAGWSNYFVFAPGIKSDSFRFELADQKYTNETYVQYLHCGNKANVDLCQMLSENGETFSYMYSEALKYHTFTSVNTGPVYYDVPNMIAYVADVVIFDKYGELAYIRDAGKGNITKVESEEDKNGMPQGLLYGPKILWDNKDEYVIPENLRSTTCHFAIKSFEVY